MPVMMVAMPLMTALEKGQCNGLKKMTEHLTVVAIGAGIFAYIIKAGLATDFMTAISAPADSKKSKGRIRRPINSTYTILSINSILPMSLGL